VGYQPFLTTGPLFIAVDGGYFAEQGLDVELLLFTSTSEMLPALLQGQLDLWGEAVTAGAINAVSQDSGFKFVGDKGFIDPNATCVDQAIVVRTELLTPGFLDNPANVKGLRFAFTKATVFEYAIDLQLQSMGLTQDDVQVIEMVKQPDRLAALNADNIDVVTFPEPWITRAKKSGAADIWVPLGKLTPYAPLGALLFGPSVTKNPDVGDRFMVAYLKAVRQYNEGKTDRNVEIIAKYTKLSPEDVKAACWPPAAADGHVHADAWEAYQDWLVSRGYLKAKIPFDQIFDSQYIDFANEALK
jgi:NitT/TauT family transport system substrate-binding protein